MDSGISIRHKLDLERMLLDTSAKPTCLALSLLEDITNNFSDDQRIGSGGFAVVYKGIVGKGIVAVKKLSTTFDMHESKFHKEVECLMKAKHKNIVRFLGYCSEAHGRTADYNGKFVMADIRNWLLCFEYVPNMSLDRYITDASHGLEWRERYKIITGISDGLLHLHEKRILHLDLKPSNILVDDHMVPKIADFGLSRCLSEEQTRAFTSNLCGSQGYLAPEFFRGQVAFLSDIYSLGVIIVEILTGEKGYPEEANVVGNWMKKLEGSDHCNVQLEQVRVCIQIGVQCMDLDPKKRPVARHIIDKLDQTESTVEISTSRSSGKQYVSFLNKKYCQEKNAKLSSEYVEEDIKEHPETEELVEYNGTSRGDDGQQGQKEVPGDQHLEEDTKQNINPQSAKARMNYLRHSGPMLEKIESVKLFKKEKLKPILNGHNFIGRDSFRKVYVGLIDGVPVVVKKLIGMLESEEFAIEVIIQSQVVHNNIVRFVGCCVEVDIPMLVYEFVSERSLHDTLHGSDNVPLNLGQRLSIAAESADGLAYMHSMARSKIVLGNVKSANILLDDHFAPKISDFGISRFIYRDDNGPGLVVVGDSNYLDRVYLQTGLLTEQNDVYSFGVVILELLTRKKATHDNNSSVCNFLENHKRGTKSTDLFDKEIAVAGDMELLDNLAEIAVECLNLDLNLRPTMTDVAKRLSILNRSRKLAHLQAS